VSRDPPTREAHLVLLVIEVSILTVAAVCALRVAIKPPIRRDFRTYLPWSLVVLALGLAIAALAVAAALRWTWPRHVFALVAAVVLIALWIRARPTYGRRRGWPPGSLAIGTSFDAIGDRNFYRDQALRHGPVFKTSQFGRPVLCVTGLRLAREILQETKALAGAVLPYNRFLPKGSLRYMDTAVHDAEAPFFRSALSGLDLGQHEERARATCREMLSRLSAASRGRPEGVPPREDLDGWNFTILASLFWGLRPDDPRLAELDQAQRALDVGRTGGPKWRAGMQGSLAAVNRMMRTHSASWDAESSPATRNCALAAALAMDPDALDDPSRAHNLTIMFRLASTDLTSLLDWVLAQLTLHPKWQEAVREVPRVIGTTRGDADDVASRVVYETTRLEQSEYLYREVVRPFRTSGYNVPAGWLLRVCVQESHRDPAIFPNPDDFDPDRFIGPARSRREFSPFGVDDHGCMGVPMVHFVARVFVEELCHGYDATLTVDAPPEKGTRHRDHWRPSAKRRVRLVPRTTMDE